MHGQAPDQQAAALPRRTGNSSMAPTHYHLRLYHSGSLIQDVEQADSRQAAVARATELTEAVQAHMGAKTYTVRVEPCTLVHFPRPGADSQ
jgi:hypothetical protein